MRRAESPSRPLADDAGLSLIEMLISTLVTTAVLAAVLGTVSGAAGAFTTQPEVSDVQQRLRVAVETMQKDLLMAGAGPPATRPGGPLLDHFAPIRPYRADGAGSQSGTFQPGVMSVVFVPATTAQANMRRLVAAISSRELVVEAEPNCGSDRRDRVCGFTTGMRVMLLKPGRPPDLATVTAVQGALLHVQHPAAFSSSYEGASAVIAEAAAHTYYLRHGTAPATHELMHYDGFLTDFPVVDHVVALAFRYFGDPVPPRLMTAPDEAATDPSESDSTRMKATYGPTPPPAGEDDPLDAWGEGENCIFHAVDEGQVPRLPAMGLGEVELTPTMLTDGPWCPDAFTAGRYDADLLRIRRVQVAVRVQVAQTWLRGPAGSLFTYAGTARPSRFVPDQAIVFDVAPRNLNLGY